MSHHRSRIYNCDNELLSCKCYFLTRPLEVTGNFIPWLKIIETPRRAFSAKDTTKLTTPLSSKQCAHSPKFHLQMKVCLAKYIWKQTTLQDWTNWTNHCHASHSKLHRVQNKLKHVFNLLSLVPEPIPTDKKTSVPESVMSILYTSLFIRLRREKKHAFSPSQTADQSMNRSVSGSLDQWEESCLGEPKSNAARAADLSLTCNLVTYVNWFVN